MRECSVQYLEISDTQWYYAPSIVMITFFLTPSYLLSISVENSFTNSRNTFLFVLESEMITNSKFACEMAVILRIVYLVNCEPRFSSFCPSYFRHSFSSEGEFINLYHFYFWFMIESNELRIVWTLCFMSWESILGKQLKILLKLMSRILFIYLAIVV